MTDHREQLRQIKTFPSLVRFLRDELDWPVETDDFEELTFEYTPEELGIDPASAAKIEEIKRLRPLVAHQPWGIFFVKFEPKQLPVVALRRILAGVVVKKRATASAAEQPKWKLDDLLFISNYGDGEERKISFAHFSKDPAKNDLPTLKVLAWDELDTPLHLEHTANLLVERLAWPRSEDEWDEETWRERWHSAFELGHREVITTSKVLAERLAELARRIRDEIRRVLEIETEHGKVTRLMEAFKEALVHDLEPAGFADMYAQTIAYGLLSARIADPGAVTADDLTLHMRTNPFLRELMEAFLHVGGRTGAGAVNIDFDELGVGEVVRLLDDANMEAVIRDFGDKNPQEDPVIHFYEDFLSEYDKEQKVMRGVFYTPRPVVSHIVQSVDELLRDELGLEDGLADTTTWAELAQQRPGMTVPDGIDPSRGFVQILDPATGTGTFLVEVIALIHRRMTDKWSSQGRGDDVSTLWNEWVPRHLLPRLHGYELLMAPYAIAHLKIGLKLYETGYDFNSSERVRVYLTNALEPASDSGQQIIEGLLPALAHEAQGVNKIKRSQTFTVIIGNPPYSNYGQLNRIPFILDLLEEYKRGLGERKINLNDDFIKFMRLAQDLIDRSGRGAVGLITNNVFLDGLTHRRMRESLLETFNRIDVLDLHGNASAHETARDGSPDENVFDIKQGVAISSMCRSGVANAVERSLRFNELMGTRDSKYEALLRGDLIDVPVKSRAPSFFFAPKDLSLSDEYSSFFALHDIFNEPSYGIQTKRDALTIAASRQEILERAAALLALDDSEVRRKFGLPADGRDWSVAWARDDIARIEDMSAHVHEVLYRPFDKRWTIYTARSKGFLAYPRWESMSCMVDQNIGLIAMRQVFQQVDIYSHVGVSDTLIDERTFYSNRGGTYLFPLYARRDEKLTTGGFSRPHNLQCAFVDALRQAIGAGQSWPAEPAEIFAYMYATFGSPKFRHRYGSLLKLDFPRLPLPRSLAMFSSLASLGAELMSLHLMSAPRLDVAHPVYTGPENPVVGRVGWSNDTVWLDAPARMTSTTAPDGTVGFKGVAESVWTHHVGGYQVCHKWLKDRKGRALSAQDIAHYQGIVAAISETIRVMQEIDAVIDEHGGWPGAFVTSTEEVPLTEVVGTTDG